MTLSDFYSCLETFEQDVIESHNDIPGYTNALMSLINDFYSEQTKKTPEQLTIEMMEFVIHLRRN